MEMSTVPLTGKDVLLLANNKHGLPIANVFFVQKNTFAKEIYNTKKHHWGSWDVRDFFGRFPLCESLRKMNFGVNCKIFSVFPQTIPSHKQHPKNNMNVISHTCIEMFKIGPGETRSFFNFFKLFVFWVSMHFVLFSLPFVLNFFKKFVFWKHTR